MNLPKRFRRLISFFVSLTLLFQTFAPTIALAQEAIPGPVPGPTEEVTSIPTPSFEATAEVTPTETPTPSPTENITPSITPEPTAEPTVTPTLEVTTQPTPLPTSELAPEITPELELSETPLSGAISPPTPVPTPAPLWNDIDSDTVVTNDLVGEGIDYRYRDSEFLIRFTKLTRPGKLTIRQIRLTPEQVLQTGALSGTAYEVTSEMENGSFTYDLTLPLPEQQTGAEIEFASTAENLGESQETPQIEELGANTITVKGLDHFTIFFVTSGRDKATNGNGCNGLSGNPCAFNTSEKTSLKYDDDDKLTITDYVANPDEIGFWPDLGYGTNRYVQFGFDPNIPVGTTIVNAYLKIVYQTNAIDSDRPYEAKVRLLSPNVDISSIGPNLSTTDQTYLIPISAQHLTRAKLNNLKARFYMFASPRDDEDGVWASFDQVVLLVNYSPPTLSFDPPQNPTNDDTPTLTGTALSSGGSTIKDVEYRVDGGGWLPGLPTDGEFDSDSEAFNLTSEPLTEGDHLFEARAQDSFDTYQTEIVSLSLTSDLTRPTANLVFPVPGPTATGFQVEFSEPVNSIEAVDPANYFLDNWPGAGSSGSLSGHADIDYDSESHTSTIIFSTPGWYISPEQNWGVKNIPDLAGNQLDDTWEYSTLRVAPTAPGIPSSTPDPTNAPTQFWSWLSSSDPGGADASGIKGYWYQVSGPTPTPWTYLGNILSVTTSLTEGISEFSVLAEDRAGNQGASASGTLTVDTTPPVAPGLISPANGLVTRGDLLTNRWSTVSDAVTYIYESYHDAAATNLRWRQTINAPITQKSAPNVPDATFWWRVRAIDAAGNESERSPLWQVIVDNTKPALTGKTEFSGWYNSDQESEFFYADQNGIVSGLPVTCTISSQGENQTCSVIPNVCDDAGNCSTALVTSNGANIDKTIPEIISLETQDNNRNGKIDAIKITFSEDIDDSRLEEGSDGWLVQGYDEPSIETGDLTNDNILVLGFPEGGNFDTDATPVVTYTPSGGDRSTHDQSGNELADLEKVADDKAAPVLVSAITRDSDLDGRIDQIVATLSEDINGSSSTPADYLVDGFSIDEESESAGVITLTLVENDTDNDTGAKPQVSLISGEGSGVKDLADNWSNDDNSVEAADGAAPVTTLTSPNQETYYNSAINISGSSSDSNGQSEPETVDFTTLFYRQTDSEGEWVEITRLSNEEGSEPLEWNYDWTPGGDGTYDIKAAATDTDGNQEGSAIVTGIVYDTANPIVTYTDENPSDGLNTNDPNQTFSVKLNEAATSCKLYFGSNGTVASATSQLTWHHSYPEDTQWTWHFYSPSGRDYSFPDRYANSAGGWNQWVPPVIYDMSDTFSGDELNGTWRLQMRDNVGRDSGAITRIDLVLNDVSHLWTGSAGIWDYHTTAVDIPVEGGSGGESSGTYNMNVSEDGLSADVTLESISDGTYDYNVKCLDRSANEGASNSRNVSIDTVAPTATVDYSTTEYISGSVTATITPSETVTTTNNGGSASREFTENGSFEFTFIDSAGNTGSVTATVENIDTTDPESVITSPENDGSDNTIYTNDWDGTIEGTASDNLSGLSQIELSIRRLSDGEYWDGEGWSESGEEEPRVKAAGTENWSYILLEPAEDSYEIVSHAVDNAGNIENSYKLTIVLDKTIPEVTISLDPATPDSGNNWYKTEPTITLTAVDDTVTDHIEYQWDSTSGAWTIYGLSFKTIGEGNHTLYYRAFDKAGNVSGIGIKNIKYDKTELTDAPLNISVSPNPTSGTTVKVKWEAASDNVGIEKYEVNWSLDGTSTSYTDTVGNEVREHEINKLDQEGKWNITVTALDYAGNKKSGSTELIVDRSAPTAPTLILGGTGVGSADLNWNKISDAVDYIIWYGNASGIYLYGARTGNTDNFTVRGLGAGDYFFVIQSVDNAGNRSGNSNEVNTLGLVGAPGVEPGTPAEGFTPEVKAAQTTTTPTPTEASSVLGAVKGWDLPWWLVFLLIPSGGLLLWSFLRR